MTKKDYIIIARAIKNAWKHTMLYEGYTSKIEAMSLIGSLSTELSKDNPRFNEQKFIDACQVS